MKIIETDELYLRNIQLSDIDNGWLNWINDRSLSKYLANAKSYTRDDLVEYMNSSILPSSILFAVCRQLDGKYIGNARLSSIDDVNKAAAYGRLIGDRNHQCNNVGTNVLIMLAYYAFCIMDLNRIYTGVVVDNIASVKSNIKAGFRCEGVSRESAFYNGKFVDSMQFALLRSDFFSNENLLGHIKI